MLLRGFHCFFVVFTTSKPVIGGPTQQDKQTTELSALPFEPAIQKKRIQFCFVQSRFSTVICPSSQSRRQQYKIDRRQWIRRPAVLSPLILSHLSFVFRRSQNHTSTNKVRTTHDVLGLTRDERGRAKGLETRQCSFTTKEVAK